MKSDWTLRWWDVIALLAAMVAAVLAVQYGLARRGAAPPPGHPEAGQAWRIQVRVFAPLPAVAARVKTGDEIFDSGGRTIGRVVSAQAAARAGAFRSPEAMAGDVLITADIRGELPLFRNTAGLPHVPLKLKPGVWCLLSSFEYELAGEVFQVERIGPDRDSP